MDGKKECMGHVDSFIIVEEEKKELKDDPTGKEQHEVIEPNESHCKPVKNSFEERIELLEAQMTAFMIVTKTLTDGIGVLAEKIQRSETELNNEKAKNKNLQEEIDNERLKNKILQEDIDKEKKITEKLYKEVEKENERFADCKKVINERLKDEKIITETSTDIHVKKIDKSNAKKKLVKTNNWTQTGMILLAVLASSVAGGATMYVYLTGTKTIMIFLAAAAGAIAGGATSHGILQQ